MTDSEMGNPFCNILDLIREESGRSSIVSWRLGIVKAISPFSVDCGGMTVDGDSLVVNVSLIDRTRIKPYLVEVGDMVVLLCDDVTDSFVAVCKVT